MLQAKRMSTKPAGEKKLSNAEKQKRYREKNKEILKEAKKGKKQIKVYEGLPTITPGKGQTRVKRSKKRRQKNAANNNIDEEPLVVNMEA